jgi:hypothetical protein
LVRGERKKSPHELRRRPGLKGRESFFHPGLQCFAEIVGPKSQSEAFVLFIQSLNKGYERRLRAAPLPAGSSIKRQDWSTVAMLFLIIYFS